MTFKNIRLRASMSKSRFKKTLIFPLIKYLATQTQGYSFTYYFKACTWTHSGGITQRDTAIIKWVKVWMSASAGLDTKLGKRKTSFVPETETSPAVMSLSSLCGFCGETSGTGKKYISPSPLVNHCHGPVYI